MADEKKNGKLSEIYLPGEYANISADWKKMLTQPPQKDVGKILSRIKPTLPQEAIQEILNLSVKLFKQAVSEGGNTLVSPISILAALAMAANGAKGNTLAQMEDVFGMSLEKLNETMKACLAIPVGGKIANSIWLNDDGNELVEEFQKINKKYYNAKVSKVPFDDTTVQKINNWVCEKTNGMINEIFDWLDPTVRMCLINAVAFDAQWENAYEDHRVKQDIFTMEDGTEQSANLMYSKEDIYLSDENAVGFMKYYKNFNYAFVGILPREGITVSEYLEALNGEKLYHFLHDTESAEVYAAIPKFESQFETEISTKLEMLGIKDAFSHEADFSGMCSKPVNIDQVLHKTFISVDERGTKAVAVTCIGLDSKCMTTMKQVHYVYLNRPFIYMILDTKNKIPLFIGTQMKM